MIFFAGPPFIFSFPHIRNVKLKLFNCISFAMKGFFSLPLVEWKCISEMVIHYAFSSCGWKIRMCRNRQNGILN